MLDVNVVAEFHSGSLIDLGDQGNSNQDTTRGLNMGKETKISWTNKTHNFWYGCRKVSAGCKSCYAERDMKRFGKDFNIVTKAKGFISPLMWKEPSMVFVNSWSDFFIEEADPWRDEAWDIIRRTPHLTYQILTKRVENIPDRLPDDWGEGWDNIWLGVSIESLEYVPRSFALIDIPAQVRFISAEPLIEYLCLPGLLPLNKIHWIIVGGESGPGCRPMDLQWARELLIDCKYHGVAFFMKQLGGHPDRREDINQFPEDLRIQEFPDVNKA